MKKTVFLIAVMFSSVLMLRGNSVLMLHENSVLMSEMHVSGDTCIASNGVRFIVGQDITLGPGSGINGSYVWIHTAPGFSAPIYLPAGWAGYKMRIKEIREMGTKKRGYKKYLILGGGNIVNYWMDMEEGLASGEIRVPAEMKDDKEKAKEGDEISVADELAKLKELMDDSIITKEEFDIQKAKLLNK